MVLAATFLIDTVIAIHRSYNMVFTLRPSAQLTCLATRAGLGRITRSSGIGRFVQGGIVKIFRCAIQLEFL